MGDFNAICYGCSCFDLWLGSRCSAGNIPLTKHHRAAGGTSDVIARLISEQMSQALRKASEDPAYRKRLSE